MIAQTRLLNRCYAKILMLAVMVLTVVPAVNADDIITPPSRSQKRVGKLVAELMTRTHLSRRELDTEISSRAFKLYMKMLDPTKSYFLQSDVDDFAAEKKSIAENVKNGNFDFGIKVYKTFLERVKQRTELAIELAGVEHDFTVKEEMITDPDLATYATSEAEARDVWRKRIKYNLLVFRGDEELDKEDGNSEKKKKKVDPVEKLQKRYTSFARRMMQTDTEDIIEMYVTAVTNSFDPHTSYMSRRSYENFVISLSLELEGIGATLSGNDEGYTVIRSIVPGGACDTQGGISVDDVIMEVGQGDETGNRVDPTLAEKNGTDFIDINSMKLDDVVGMIRGKAGTVVRLNVQSEEGGDIRTVEIVREKIKLEDSAAQGKVFEQGTNADGSPRKIGIIELPSFYADMSGRPDGRSTTTDVKRILDQFNDEGVDGVVLDLRKNGGGSLQEAIDCTGLFIDAGPVVQIKDASNQIIKLDDNNRGASWSKPVVVLTSKFSASASEILAGALQDYDRGIIVGDTTTHGKGTVQTLMDLNEVFYRMRNAPNKYGALKITRSQFYRPNGDSTQKRGVLSDLVLPSVTDKMPVGESDLEYPVEFDRISAADYSSYGSADEEVKKALQIRSAERVKASDKFAKRIRRIEEYVRQKDMKTVSLNEEEFLARSRELRAEKEDEKVIEEQVSGNKEIKRDYYLDEVLEITADYMTMLEKRS
ncbi:carboxy terminal-processing peptidase [Mariniblastus fucicola]|uniref:Tail-specific protease n=1 Tax=Mariniblastus fucicola TaxID=980251 RepID=A0A5B9PEJ7_9BACT|nr:carboxy terminal-processing peptidase [Mariniblastus fucicola]QEG23929.1 Tail-specific protease precursor [Mariniblastus fucicola]